MQIFTSGIEDRHRIVLLALLSLPTSLVHLLNEFFPLYKKNEFKLDFIKLDYISFHLNIK